LDAKKTTKDLVGFAVEIGVRPICVTYFDEADELDVLYWIILRVLSNQDDDVVS